MFLAALIFAFMSAWWIRFFITQNVDPVETFGPSGVHGNPGEPPYTS